MTVERQLSLQDPQDPGGTVHVTLRGHESAPVAEVRAALGRLAPAGTTLFAGSRLFPDEGTLGELELPQGALLGWGGPVAPSRIERPWTRFEMRVVGGPAAGRVFPLPPGPHELGRSGTGLVLSEDRLLSRRHLRLDVDAEGVRIEDVGSSNPTLLEGTAIAGVTPLPLGSLVLAGNSLLTVVEAQAQGLRLLRQPDGRLGLNRRFRSGEESLPDEIPFPQKPTPSERPTLNLALTLAPAAGAAVLAVVMGRIEFLLFMVLSPLIGVGNSIARRRAHDAKLLRDKADFESKTIEAQEALARTRQEEVGRLRTNQPDVAAVVQCARATGRLLWARRGVDPDLLELRVGSGPRRSQVRAQGAAFDDPQLWMAPVSVPLRATGGIGVIGPIGRARGLARSLVLQAVTLHSPTEVRLVVLCDEGTEAEWGWVRWLPHARWAADEPFLLIGSDPESAATRLHELRELVKRRREAKSNKDDVLLPLVLVVYDGAARLVSQGFAEILKDGPRLGIHAISVDEVQVPEGCDAAVTIDDHGDARVEQAGAPVQEHVIADTVGPETCDLAARCMAPLRLIGEDGVVELPAQLRLLDLLDLPEPTAEEVLRLWSAGRTPAAPVGLSTNGPLLVDLTRDGPHGVIAGASRSGKSEFLKTFIASLAARNHPDDLSFLFIDFKGGNDYQLAATLPHTVDLATQIDPAGFERALQLLDAEIVRRQGIAKKVQTSTIEGYWAAQAGAGPGTTPTLGRLVVIVDEFAELAQKSPEQLDRLVSVARVGAAYGVHLILATQRPAGVVSGQIDANAPLRVCFRTTAPEHSSDVLGSRLAADIAERHRGRGYKKAHQEQPGEFQCARVGNARPGSTADAEPLVVAPQRWTTLGHIPPEDRGAGEVPDPETDFYDLVQAIREAAARSQWTATAVPWPKPLPTVVGLDELPPIEAGVAAGALPFAVVDDPARQAHLAAPLLLGEGHIAIAGSGGTGRTSALRTMATSAASHTSSADLHVYAFDFSRGGLSALSQLPHCGGVASGDPEVVGRMLDHLESELRERRNRFETVGAGGLPEYNSMASDGARLPWLLVLIDGWEIVHEDSQTASGSSLHDRLLRVLSDGQRFGLQAVVAGDRWVATGRAGRVVYHRFLLRFNSEIDYDAAGVRASTVPDHMPPGRAIGGDGRVYQIGVLGDGSGLSQSESLRTLAAEVREREADVPLVRQPRRIQALPNRVSLRDLVGALPPPDGAKVPVMAGFAAVAGGPRWLDLADDAPSFVVVGRRRSGRSSALLAFARSALENGVEVVALAPKASPLRCLDGLPGVIAVHSGDAARTARLNEVAQCARALVVVDDADALEPAHSGLTALIEMPHGARGIVVASTTEFAKSQMTGYFPALRRNRCGVILCPETPYDGGALGAPNLARSFIFDQPAGRGVLSISGELGVLQVGLTTPGDSP